MDYGTNSKVIDAEKVAYRTVLNPRDSARRSDWRRPIHFTLRCACDQAYLLLADAEGKAMALNEMTRDGNVWRLTLSLQPGGYRYRYYVCDGRSTLYFSPADAEPVGRVMRMDGMDGLFDVVPPSRCLFQWSGDAQVAASRLKSGYAALAPPCPGYV